MGAEESKLAEGGSSLGFHVLGVAAGSPADEAGIEAYIQTFSSAAVL